MFSLFLCNPFPHGKGKLSCAANPYRLAHFLCRTPVTLSYCVKHFWKCRVTSEIHKTFCFLLFQEKVEKVAKFLETATVVIGSDDGYWQWWWLLAVMMVIGTDDAEFGYHLKFVTLYYRRQDLTFGFCSDIRGLKMNIFVNFELDLNFQCQQSSLRRHFWSDTLQPFC